VARSRGIPDPLSPHKRMYARTVATVPSVLETPLAPTPLTLGESGSGLKSKDER